jgi:2-dehydro-3-deoxyglucarate aldolase/4-hydroxy-2-oxoheptanedioate aldolase
MSNAIIERLRSGKLVRTMHVTGFVKPRAIEMLGLTGSFHGIWVDQEHAACPHSELESMLIACRAAGIDAFSRVPPTDYCTVMRPLEAGCSGIMVAQIRTLDEVKQMVEWAKYPPIGRRGFFGATYESRYGDVDMATHVERANRERWIAIQIETPEAVEIVDQIAAVKGVDWLYLSATLGVPGDFLHPKCVDALKRVARAVKSAGKPWGTLSRDPEHANACRDLGCQLFSVFGDIDCLRTGLAELDKRFADLQG